MKYVNIFYTPGLGKLSWNSLWFDKVGETCHTTVRLICHQILHHSMLQIFWKIVGLIWLTIWELLNKDLDVGLCPSGGHKTIRMYTRFVCMLVNDGSCDLVYSYSYRPSWVGHCYLSTWSVHYIVISSGCNMVCHALRLGGSGMLPDQYIASIISSFLQFWIHRYIISWFIVSSFLDSSLHHFFLSSFHLMIWSAELISSLLWPAIQVVRNLHDDISLSRAWFLI